MEVLGADWTGSGSGQRIGGVGGGRKGFVLDSAPVLSAPCRASVSGASPLEGDPARMRRYELMLVLRPDVADDQSQAVVDRTTRGRSSRPAARSSRSPRGAAAAWPIPIDRHREGSYHIILFEAPSDADRRARAHPAHHRGGPAPPRAPASSARSRSARGDGSRAGEDIDDARPPVRASTTRTRTDDREFIDESESEAAPAAID